MSALLARYITSNGCCGPVNIVREPCIAAARGQEGEEDKKNKIMSKTNRSLKGAVPIKEEWVKKCPYRGQCMANAAQEEQRLGQSQEALL